MQVSSLTTARVARSMLQRASGVGSLRVRSRVHMGALGLTIRSKSSLAGPAEAAMAASSADPELHEPFEPRPETTASMPPLETADWAIKAQQLIPRSTLQKPFQLSVSEELDQHLGKVMASVTEPLASEMEASSRAFISEEEVDKWLADFKIPAEHLATCSTPEQVQELRRRYARQLRLECTVFEMAVDKFQSSHDQVRRLGRASHTNAAQALIGKWAPRVVEFIKLEQKSLTTGGHSLDSNIYGSAFLLLKPEELSATALNIMLNTCLMEANGPKFIKLALAMGKAVQEIIINKKETTERRYNDPNRFWMIATKKIKPDSMKNKMKEMINDVGAWDKRLQLKVGAALIDCIQRTCFVPNAKGDVMTPEICASKGLDPPTPAFMHDYVFERNRRAGVIRINPQVASTVLATSSNSNALPWTARYLPMLVPPRPWTNVVDGGYLKLRTKIMRQRDMSWQIDCVRRGDLSRIFKALNLMSEVPWVINKEVLEVVLKVWEDGGEFGDLPTRKDVPLPDRNAEEFQKDPTLYTKMVHKIEQLNRQNFSLQCDTKYKLQVAEEFKDEPEIYYPYNMDFRGRVYPIPPNLNHLGSDLSRSLLIFRDRKPLGENGLRWMKIHLANVFGVDKCSFDERVVFAEAHLEQVVASALNPHGEGDCAWWKGADYPFLALGVCFELKRAIESPDPTKYMSNIPIHQDGSCNGLQHYAALGRDLTGGEQVNLVPAPRPSDVYMGVAHQVMAKVEHDAALDALSTKEAHAILKATIMAKAEKVAMAKHLTAVKDLAAMLKKKSCDPEKLAATMKLAEQPEEITWDGDKERELRNDKQFKDAFNKEQANFLLGTITRKVVKQTVMTSVYGVTYIGARKQISARLHETFLTKGHIMNETLEDEIYRASCYCADLTMGSMGDLFNSARSIQHWLAECAGKVSESGQGMSWITPLGLPVVQPYRGKDKMQVRTKMQHVLMKSDTKPVSSGRQKSAFPPNFVHSLDSTHMLLTAQRCLEEEKIAFAAVHDSYWTHACSVDIMNRRLREEFVHLYEQPLLEELLEELRMRFPQTEFENLPELGDLDLRSVLDSPYFFN